MIHSCFKALNLKKIVTFLAMEVAQKQLQENCSSLDKNKYAKNIF